jgi:hypothetical protein
MSETYQPSGKYNLAAVVTAAAAGAVFSALTAIPYAFAVWYVPLLILTPLLPVLWAYCTAAVAGIFIRSGRIRSPRAAGLAGVVSMLPGYYLAWAATVSLFINFSGNVHRLGSGRRALTFAVSNIDFGQIKEMLLNPAVFWKFVAGPVNENFTRTVFGAEINGGILWAVWAAELLLIFVLAYVFFDSKASKPFSEICDRFFPEVNPLRFSPLPSGPEDAARLVNELAQGDVSYLLTAVPLETGKGGDSLKMTVYFMPDDLTAAYLTVDLLSKDSKGKSSSKTLVTCVRIQTAQAAALIEKYK